jgi:hypothetical protein
MTLNNILNRIRQIALSHKQVRNFYKGLVTDFLTDKTTRYPSVFLQDNGGLISTSGHATTLNFRMYILDLVHVSEETKLNEYDVLSDMLSIAMDIVTQMNAGDYQDWRLSADNNVQLVTEYDNDMVAGCVIDFQIAIMFRQDLCQIPSDLTIIPLPEDNMKLVYDEKYIANGTEGITLTTCGEGAHIPVLCGKKILLITREFTPLYRVSSAPVQTEFTWNDSSIGLGMSTVAGERFLILYRTY